MITLNVFYMKSQKEINRTIIKKQNIKKIVLTVLILLTMVFSSFGQTKTYKGLSDRVCYKNTETKNADDFECFKKEVEEISLKVKEKKSSLKILFKDNIIPLKIVRMEKELKEDTQNNELIYTCEDPEKVRWKIFIDSKTIFMLKSEWSEKKQDFSKNEVLRSCKKL